MLDEAARGRADEDDGETGEQHVDPHQRADSSQPGQRPVSEQPEAQKDAHGAAAAGDARDHRHHTQNHEPPGVRLRLSSPAADRLSDVLHITSPSRQKRLR
jgi:hypothetical protein